MVIQFSDLAALRKKHSDKTIVLGSGVFDLIHIGHVEYLQSLANEGDIVVAMVKNDARVRTFKSSSRPVVPEQDRVAMVDAIKGVDYAFVAPYEPSLGSGQQPKIDAMYEAVFQVLKPDIFYTGNPDWKKLEGLGTVKVVLCGRSERGYLKSTTEIINTIKNS